MQPDERGDTCKSARMDAQQAATRALVLKMLDETGYDPTTLARKAGVATSTVTRFLNAPVKWTLSARTLAKLSVVSGIPVPMGVPSDGAEPRGEFVHDREELAWLELWRRMTDDTRGAAITFLDKIAPPTTKVG
jgi:hypothetical protein